MSFKINIGSLIFLFQYMLIRFQSPGTQTRQDQSPKISQDCLQQKQLVSFSRTLASARVQGLCDTSRVETQTL